MQQWAASKQLPGQFLGSTGLNVLPQKDIFNHNPRNQAWVKKVCAQGKVSGGRSTGAHMEFTAGAVHPEG